MSTDDLRTLLDELSHNLWWSWDTAATECLASIDPHRWARYRHNPIAVLCDVETERLDSLARDESYVARVRDAVTRQRSYLASSGWCAEAAPELGDNGGVAYLSMEFGLHESLPLYSGGLGVLAGDHIRSASDLDVPLVGVSLLYRSGYFRQVIEQGQQLAAYPTSHFDRLPLTRCTDDDGLPVQIKIPLGDRAVHAQIWVLQVGRNPLYLLDTDVDANEVHDRALTSTLYGGGSQMRIEQEVLLGLGGVRALQALGLTPAVYHLNEGHCAFVVLQLVADAMADGASFDDALAFTRRRCVFTTHTPVPAGHDRFDEVLVDDALGSWAQTVGLSTELLMQLGRVHEADIEETLCMTVVALKGARAANGVSALHGEVSREMWQPLYPDTPVDAVPIGHVTNGVHPLFWMAPPTRALFDSHLPGWRDRVWDPTLWAGIDAVPDGALQELRHSLRGQLVQLVRDRTGADFRPDRLTIGFARRFAPYKRGWLVFSDPDRLAALLDRGVQLVFAGKAHPRDDAGKHIVSQVVRFSEQAGFRDRVVLLEDYDMHLGRVITAGADVWLNNPRRPKEASGTSGQKVCFNGGLNLSILDGWWPEGFDGTNGWAIGDGTVPTDHEAQDAADALQLYEILEQKVLPTWEEPAAWMRMVRSCIKTCAPAFSSHRMVRDYVLDLYRQS